KGGGAPSPATRGSARSFSRSTAASHRAQDLPRCPATSSSASADNWPTLKANNVSSPGQVVSAGRPSPGIMVLLLRVGPGWFHLRDVVPTENLREVLTELLA